MDDIVSYRAHPRSVAAVVSRLLNKIVSYSYHYDVTKWRKEYSAPEQVGVGVHLQEA